MSSGRITARYAFKVVPNLCPKVPLCGSVGVFRSPKRTLLVGRRGCSDTRMQQPGPIWVDDRNPIYRRGLIKCLENEGYMIAGESAALRPLPELSRSSVLIFDLDAAGPDVAATLANRCALTIGLVREMPAGQVRELLAAGLSVALPLRTLTPANLLACLRTHGKVKVAQPVLNGAAVGSGGGGRHLTRRELDVLSLLADGDTTREIAQRLSYSERTVKNIVHDVRAKLKGRTRAHAVALASRRGLI
jgi:DNA-binding NarL/FixJ family response regulator